MILFETLSQVTIVLWFLFCGFVCGFLFEIANTIKKRIKIKIFLYFFDFFTLFFTLICFYITNLFINYGQMRFYTFAIFAISIFTSKFITHFFFTKIKQICYNKLNGRRKKEKQVVEKV